MAVQTEPDTLGQPCRGRLSGSLSLARGLCGLSTRNTSYRRGKEENAPRETAGREGRASDCVSNSIAQPARLGRRRAG